jgi:outer membrane protein OmpA-like peptidoglycan-associated protein
VTVTTSAGTATLDRPGQAVALSSRDRAPEAASLTDQEVRTLWAEALAHEPPAPVSFILYFILDSTTLTPESRRSLSEVLGIVRARPAPEVAVVGYTDRSGTNEYNYELGLRRAQAVRREIEAAGVPSSLISVASYGPANPLIPNAREFEPRNRRVELTVR